MMDEKFWLRRWENNDIGFHKEEPHHSLVRFFDALHVSRGEQVLVPLCGKSPDLAWLHERGLRVAGVELSRLAVEAFISENHLQGEWAERAGLPCYLDRGYRLYCGDFFSLTAAALGDVRAAYDRGSLVALPPVRRKRYAAHLAGLLAPGGRALLISYDYDQAETCGPPFSVPYAEIAGLFGGWFEIELLGGEDVLWSHQRLATRGVTALTEFAVLLTRQ
jgi:thiopurine S-methyltransferase